MPHDSGRHPQRRADTDQQSGGSERLMADAGVLRYWAVGALSRGFLHDVVNPINVMLMNAELGLLSLDDRDATSAALTTIVNEAKRVGEMVSRVSRFAYGDGIEPSDERRMAEVVDAARRLLGSEMRRRNVTLELHVDERHRLPCDDVALAVALAEWIRCAADLGADALRLAAAAENGEAALTLEHNAGPLSVRPVKLLLIRQIVTAHHGRCEESDGVWTMRLPATTAAG